ncbi:hypothetical protein FHG87_002532 [Trinorchestia longiramus]|nr:hypothetical protein FHG87_002532 [Trinorchestia longiramus]
MRLYRQRIKNEQWQEILERERQRQQVRRAAMNDVQREEYREQQRNLSQQKKENRDEEQRAQYLQQQKNLSQQRRENMDEEQRSQFLERQRNFFQQREQNMNEEDRMNYHQNQRERYRQRIENINPGEFNHLRQNQQQRQRIRRNKPVVDIANIIDLEPFDTGEMNVRCEYCDARRFRNEAKNCYHNGKVSVPVLQPCPEAQEIYLREIIKSLLHSKKKQELQLCIILCVFWSKLCVSPEKGFYCFRIQSQTSQNDKSVPW